MIAAFDESGPFQLSNNADFSSWLEIVFYVGNLFGFLLPIGPNSLILYLVKETSQMVWNGW